MNLPLERGVYWGEWETLPNETDAFAGDGNNRGRTKIWFFPYNEFREEFVQTGRGVVW